MNTSEKPTASSDDEALLPIAAAPKAGLTNDAGDSEKGTGPGAIIRYAREQQGMSDEQLAAELKISKAKLATLEGDDFDAVGTATFVRGYLRNAARVLQIDPAILLGEYEMCVGSTKQKIEQAAEVEPSVKPDKRPQWLLPAGGLAGLLLLWVIVASLLGDDSPEAQNTADTAAEPSQVQPETAEPAINAATTEVQTSPTGPGQGSADIGRIIAQSQNPQPQTSLAPAREEKTAAETLAEEQRQSQQAQLAQRQQTEQQQALSPDESVLQFSFSEECWLEVRDNSGERQFSGVKAAGDSLRVEGEAPFNLRIGNVYAMRLKVNGKDYPLNPVGNRKTLRINVP
ncbi:MAG: DUF4115 domain-containing protein [Cellvibrionaceae bacterium]|nr:DUF4115 domain-containing protein [Cellvibrionaceae bacterium]